MKSDAVRDWSQIGVKDQVYVSRTGLSLRELAEKGFDLSDDGIEEGHSCDSGYCFT